MMFPWTNRESRPSLDRRIVDRRSVALIALGALCGGCTDDAALTEPPSRRLALTGGPVELSIAQRSSLAIPGSEGRVLLTIGDITGKQVLTSIATEDGRSVLATLSMRAADSADFTLDEQLYTLTLNALDNSLLGTDTATYRIQEGTPGLTENDVIELLIQAVASLGDAKFVRNGDAHSSAEAAEHLRTKWNWKSDDIATAEDFIAVAATGSSMSGKAYFIRFPDGREVPSAEFLSGKLAALRQGR